jgi:hypothetical protein
MRFCDLSHDNNWTENKSNEIMELAPSRPDFALVLAMIVLSRITMPSRTVFSGSTELPLIYVISSQFGIPGNHVGLDGDRYDG